MRSHGAQASRKISTNRICSVPALSTRSFLLVSRLLLQTLLSTHNLGVLHYNSLVNWAQPRESFRLQRHHLPEQKSLNTRHHPPSTSNTFCLCSLHCHFSHSSYPFYPPLQLLPSIVSTRDIPLTNKRLPGNSSPAFFCFTLLNITSYHLHNNIAAKGHASRPPQA